MAQRGRPKKAEEDRILKRKIGMLPGQWETVEEAAEIRGMTMTEYIRWVSVNYSKKLIEKKNKENGDGIDE